MGLGKMMDYFTVMFLVTTTLLLSLSPPASSQSSAPVQVDLTNELTTEGPFATFLDLLRTSNTIQILQAQADKMNQDNTQDGLTLFAPNDLAFAALPGPFALSALTAPELTSLCLFHALPQYYGTSNFLTLSKMNPVSTMAGGPYTLNFTNANGGLNLSTGLSSAKVLQATAHRLLLLRLHGYTCDSGHFNAIGSSSSCGYTCDSGNFNTIGSSSTSGKFNAYDNYNYCTFSGFSSDCRLGWLEWDCFRSFGWDTIAVVREYDADQSLRLIFQLPEIHWDSASCFAVFF
ncbi:hypothetical protein RHSIM_Rhsim04G0044900 [Rhododendron simsii]|uniref:FAS1 domain-containing protein n=1 Tax=Rhododendron simsii TaxID=118357 RepID=A0A834H1S8_RHOSS|nr:hypothetical protein RHSIM_Rhsim04G0044900 [Rhododendron simsii]